MKDKNCKPEILLVLLANAPIIKSKWIKECIKILKNNKKITAIVPVTEDNDHHPLRAKKIKEGFFGKILFVKFSFSVFIESSKFNFLILNY